MKRIKITLLCLSLFFCAYASYFKSVPTDITQPDKTVIHCFTTGDEFYHALHDKDGYTIVQSDIDGYFYYAVKSGEKLVPSVYKVESIDPKTIGIEPWLKISVASYNEIVNQFQASNAPRVRPFKASALSSGSLSNIVIYVRFKGEAEFTKTRKEFSNMLTAPRSASLRNYYEEVSYGKFTINSQQFPICDSTVSLSYEDVQPRGYFSPYNAVTNTVGYVDDSGSREQSLIERAINAVSPQIPTNTIVDADGDGYVDNVTVVIRGNADGWGKLLWPHRWSLYMNSASILGKRVSAYIFVTENMFATTTMCHEMFHVVGAPDLYHYTSTNDITPAGYWDLMQNGSGHMTAYMKWKYTGQTWISSIPEITKSGDYSVKALTSPTKNCYKIKSPYSSTEFYILEYRKKTGIYESNLPGTGMIISRINSLVGGNSNGPPDEVYICRPQGTIYSNGDLSIAALSNLAGRPSFNTNSNPRDFLSDGSDAGIDITNIALRGDSMTFHVNFTENLMQKSLWLVTADSFEASAGYNPGTMVRDDKYSSFWATSTTSQYPHWVQVVFRTPMNLKGFKYLPRQDSDVGRIKDYEFYTSVDGANWANAASGTFPNTKNMQVITFAERNCKYVKLVAKNEVNQRNTAAVAELDFIFNTTFLPKTKWTLLNATSFEIGKEPRLAFDSLGTTFWSSKSTAPAAVYPHALAIDMNDTCCIEGVTYLPRQDGIIDGTIAKYEFYTSLDALSWKLVSKGQWANNSGEKQISFPKTVCRYIKLVGISEVNAKTYANVAEIGVFGSKSHDIESPTKPVNFRLVSRTGNVAKLAWNANLLDNSILYYKIFTPDSIVGQVYTNEISVRIDTTKNYSFALMAVDGSGNFSDTASVAYVGLTDLKQIDSNQPIVYSTGNVIYVNKMLNVNRINVFNILGELIISKECNSSNEEIPMNDANGVFIVSLLSNNTTIFNKKVIVKDGVK
jgi:M6 family metalloprotease-like protein